MIFMMIGLPGSGKSTFAHSSFSNDIIVSSDEIRKELYGDESIQGDGKQVFNIFYKRLKKIHDEKNIVVADATFLTKKSRKTLFQKFPNAEIIGVQMLTPWEVCLERNKDRERTVPRDAMEIMYKKFQLPSIKEGFSLIIKGSV